MTKESDPGPESWGTMAEQDLAHVVPHSYLPWWLSGPTWILVAWGAVELLPDLVHPTLASPFCAAGFLTGQVARRLPRPTLLRYWSALIAALMGFLGALLLTLNTDSLLLTTWATLLGALLAYSIVMCARRDLIAARPAPKTKGEVQP